MVSARWSSANKKRIFGLSAAEAAATSSSEKRAISKDFIRGGRVLCPKEAKATHCRESIGKYAKSQHPDERRIGVPPSESGAQAFQFCPGDADSLKEFKR